MSWDIFVQDIPSSAATINDIPDDFKPAALGLRSDIIRRICDVVPSANFRDPAWGVIEGPDFSIEVSLGEDSLVRGFAFHVRGGGDAPAVVSDIIKHLGLRAFDPGSDTGIFQPGACAEESFRRWRPCRDRVVR